MYQLEINKRILISKHKIAYIYTSILPNSAYIQ